MRLPALFDRRLVGEQARRSLAAWARLGVRPALGQDFAAGDASAYLAQPAGGSGPAFLVTRNFNAILKYNSAVFYALAVGHLGDRIGGGPALVAAWPQEQRTLGRTPPGNPGGGDQTVGPGSSEQVRAGDLPIRILRARF